MKITQETSSYNERRYSKPWIATVDFSDPKGKFAFGDWVGDGRNGGAGTLIIEAMPGQIVATGQKDFRKPSNSAPSFYNVTPDGGLEYIGDRGRAFAYYRANAKDDTEALTKEKEALLARIKEIDSLLTGRKLRKLDD